MKRKAQPITDDLRRMTVPFECKAVKASDDQEFAGEITGLAAGIHNIDRVGDMILPGAFEDDLDDFLKDGVICWQHNWMMPIGRPLEAREDSFGLLTRGRISNTQMGKDAMTLIKDGVVKKLSIGYRVNRRKKDGAAGYEWVDRAGLLAYLAGVPSSVLTDERKQSIIRTYDEMELDSLFLLRSIKLYEYSPVTVPANNNADITSAKDLGSLTDLTFLDHSKAVLTAVEGLVARIKGINALRAEQGRKANPIHADLCEVIATDLGTIQAELVQLTSALKSDAQPSVSDAQKLFAEFLKLEARLNGSLTA